MSLLAKLSALALPLGLLRRYLVLRYRLSQVPLPLLVNPLLVNDEGNSLRIPHLALVCLPSLSPLVCLEQQHAASPSCPLVPLVQVPMVREDLGLQNAGCQSQSGEKPKQYTSSLLKPGAEWLLKSHGFFHFETGDSDNFSWGFCRVSRRGSPAVENIQCSGFNITCVWALLDSRRQCQWTRGVLLRQLLSTTPQLPIAGSLLSLWRGRVDDIFFYFLGPAMNPGSLETQAYDHFLTIYSGTPFLSSVSSW